MYNTLVYYLTCNGHDPVRSMVTKSTKYTAELVHKLNQMLDSGYAPPQCSNNINISTALTLTANITADLNVYFNYLTCPPLQSTLNALINEGLCTNIPTGLFTVWLSMSAFAFMLFFLNFTTGILYRYFDPIMWNIGSSKFVLLPFAEKNEVLFDQEEVDPEDNGVQMQPVPSSDYSVVRTGNNAENYA